MRVLLNIGSYMPIKSADIAYQSRLDSYTVSRAVKVLQTKSLIEIQKDPVYRNTKFLSLNSEGKKLYKKLASALEDRGKILEEVLTNNEKKMFYDMLEKVEARTEQLLAKQALDLIEQGHEPSTDQKELIRWYRKGLKD